MWFHQNDIQIQKPIKISGLGKICINYTKKELFMFQYRKEFK
jgi:hypothetical protein